MVGTAEQSHSPSPENRDAYHRACYLGWVNQMDGNYLAVMIADRFYLEPGMQVIRSYLAATPGEGVIVDLGCADGRSTSFVLDALKSTPEIRVVAADSNPHMLAGARYSLASEIGEGKCSTTLVELGARSPSVGELSDSLPEKRVIFTLALWNHIGDEAIAQAARELRMLVGKSGIAVVVQGFDGENKFEDFQIDLGIVERNYWRTPERYGEIFSAAGFSVGTRIVQATAEDAARLPEFEPGAKVSVVFTLTAAEDSFRGAVLSKAEL